MKHKVIIILLFIIANTSYGQQWVSFNEDTLYSSTSYNTTVRSFMAEDTLLFVGGVFQYGSGNTLNHIGVWNNNIWQSLGSGFDQSGVFRMVRYKGFLYAGGAFLSASGIPNTDYIARWNGSSWEALPNTYGGIGNTVKDFVVYNDTLIIAANFPSSASRIAAYDADINDYVHIGSVPFASTMALAVYNGELYAGGSWDVLKKYIGGSGLGAWQDVGGNLNYYIQDMAVDTFNDFLYVGGGFYVVDDTIVTDNVAIWNGHYWEGIGHYGGISDVMTLAIYNGDLYTGRAADSAGGVYTKRLARWDGTNWSMVGGGIEGVEVLEVFNNKLYVGGSFDTVNGQPQKAIACWVDTTPNCRYLKPRVFTENNEDTFYLSSGSVNVQFYNNNSYANNWLWSFGDGYSVTGQNPIHTYIDTGIYHVCVTVTHDSCVKSACKTIIVLNPTNNLTEPDKKDTGFKLYPNPTSTILFIEISDKQLLITDNELRIMDVKGKTLILTSLRFRQKSEEAISTNNEQITSSQTPRNDGHLIKINIETLPAGLYFVKVQTNKGVVIKKFVKQNIDN